MRSRSAQKPVLLAPAAGPEAGRTLVLLDGHSLCYQSFYALPALTAPDGRHVGAVYGLARVLLKLIREHKPTHVAAAFDSHGPTFRHDTYAGYKANRPPMPDELREQIDLAIRLLKAMRIPVYRVASYEADDLLATLACQAAEQGLDVSIVSSDKDLKQVLSGQVRMLLPRDGSIYTAESLKTETGLSPAQMVDYQALVGDSSDHIPGVPGIGPKTAKELLGKFGTLDALFARIGEIEKPALREKLVRNQETALRNRALVTLDRKAPVDLDLAPLDAGAPFPDEAVTLLQELNFRQLLATCAPAAEVKPNAPVEYECVDTPEKLERWIARFREAKRLSVDTETTSLEPMRADLVGVSFAVDPCSAGYVPVRGPEKTRLDPETALAAVKPFLEDAGFPKIGQNLKYDWIVFRRNGIALEGIAFDTMIAAYLLNPNRKSNALDALASEYLGESMTNLPARMDKAGKTMADAPLADVTDYACRDADVALRLTDRLEPELRERGLDALLRDVEVPLVPLLAAMEEAGVALDLERFRALAEKVGHEAEGLERQVIALAGRPFNLASSQQLAEVLFTDLKLPSVKRTKTGPSTDSEVLVELSERHPLPGLVVEYRRLTKLRSTYLAALPALVHPETGRLHTSFNQTVAATGRLSSSDPNLQNIPIRTPLGQEIRAAFLPHSPGDRLLSADYSQIELRILAHMSGDAELHKAFKNGGDVHAYVASRIYGVPEKEVTSDMRRKAKMVNYALIYGKTAFTLSRDLGIPVGEAAKLMEEFFGRFSGVKRFREEVLEKARRDKEVRTLLGRIRPIPEIGFSVRPVREAAERAAINTVVQGSAADLIKLAMLRVERALRRERLAARMLIQIHDELLLNVPEEEIPRVRTIACAEMEGAMTLDVPLEVCVGVGRNWLEAHGA